MTSRLLFLVVIASFTVGAHARQAGQPGGAPPEVRQLWTLEETKEIKYVGTIAGGDLLLGSDDRLAVFNGETGKPAWSRTDITGCERIQGVTVDGRYPVRCKYGRAEMGFFVAGSKAPGVIGLDDDNGTLIVLEAATGKTTYDSGQRALGKVRMYLDPESEGQLVLWVETSPNAYAFARLDVARSEIVWQSPTSITDGLVSLGPGAEGSLLVYGKNRDGKSVVSELDVKDGRKRWDAVGVFEKDVEEPTPKLSRSGKRWYSPRYEFGPPVIDADASVLLYITKDGPLRFSRDGKVVWRARDFAGERPSPMTYGNGVLFLMRDGQVFALDGGSGKVLWKHRPKSDVLGIDAHRGGVLVWSKDTLNLLDAQSGRSLWNREVTLPEAWSLKWWQDIVVGVLSNQPYLTRGGIIVRIGDDTTYAAGYKQLISIAMRDGSTTSLATFTPPDGPLVHAFQTLDDDFVMISSQYIARLNRQGQLVFSRFYKFVEPPAFSKVGNDGSATRAYLRDNANNDRNVYFFFENTGTDEQRRYGIIGVDRRTGQELGTVWVNRRNPDLVFDAAKQTLFWQEKETSVRALRFGVVP